MTKVVFNRTIPMIDRDSFLTPFDKLFDQMVTQHYPEITKSVGVNPMQGSAYPKVNVYEYDDKIGIVAEIPGLNKKQLDIFDEYVILDKNVDESLSGYDDETLIDIYNEVSYNDESYD